MFKDCTLRIAVIDYGSGNLRSVAKALEKVAVPGQSIEIIRDARGLANASHIVLPGVGAYGDCMRGLRAIPGMVETLNEEVLGRKKWFLGICVGMQMMLERGLEHGEHEGLGWIAGEAARLKARPPLKIPHMGWNELNPVRPHPLLKGVEPGAHVYFVHSYHAECANAEDVLAIASHGGPVVAAIGRDNLMGTQFHPEKSQAAGLRILSNFLVLR